MTLTYVISRQQFYEVVWKHSDTTFQFTLPPAGINDVLIEHRDDIALGQRQLVVIRGRVWEASDSPRFGCK